MNIYFWQSNISPHQMPYISEIATMGHQVTLIVPKKGQLKIREQSGWDTPDTKGVNLIVNPGDNEIESIFETNTSEKNIHCFGGIDFDPLVFKGFVKSLSKNVKRVIISEGPDLRSWRLLVRWFYAKIKYSKYKNQIHLVMAIGQNGERYYRFMGINKNRIKPFLYCVENTNSGIIPSQNENFKALYLGGLFKIKGVDILLNSYTQLKNKFQLDIYGGGKEESNLRIITNENNLELVSYKGIVNNNKIKQFLNTYDLLILPSRKDGWGAVVNEALMAGTPVLCSDNCGAKQLIESELQGKVFKTGNRNDLKNKLLYFLNKGPVSPDKREELIKWSSKIHKTQVARFLVENLEKI